MRLDQCEIKSREIALPSVSADCRGAAGSVLSGPETTNPGHLDSATERSLAHCPPAPVMIPKKKIVDINTFHKNSLKL